MTTYHREAIVMFFTEPIECCQCKVPAKPTPMVDISAVCFECPECEIKLIISEKAYAMFLQKIKPKTFEEKVKQRALEVKWALARVENVEEEPTELTWGFVQTLTTL